MRCSYFIGLVLSLAITNSTHAMAPNDGMPLWLAKSSANLTGYDSPMLGPAQIFGHENLVFSDRTSFLVFSFTPSGLNIPDTAYLMKIGASGQTLSTWSLTGDHGNVVEVTTDQNNNIIVVYRGPGNNSFFICKHSSVNGDQLDFSAQLGCAPLMLNYDYFVYADVMVQADGKILFITEGYIPATQQSLERYELHAARFNMDGTLDNSYGSMGIAVSSLGSRAWIYNSRLASNGKLVVAGLKGKPGRAFIHRVSTSGIVDATWSAATWNWPVSDKDDNWDIVQDFDLIDDPKSAEDDIAVIGKVYRVDYNLEPRILAKIDGDTGTPDASFGLSGGYTALTTKFLSPRLAARPGGGWIVMDVYGNYAPYSNYVVGLRRDGTLDGSFPKQTLGEFKYIAGMRVKGDGIYVSGVLPAVQETTDPPAPPEEPKKYDFFAAEKKLYLDRIFADGAE